MALSLISIIFNMTIFIFYLMIFYFLIDITKNLEGDIKQSSIYFIAAISVLIFRRVQATLSQSEILNPVIYSAEITVLAFAILFFLGVFYLYKGVKELFP